MTWERITGGEANPFTIVETSATNYSASNEELVITSGDTVTLPTPVADGIVGVRDFGQEPAIETPSGTVQGPEPKKLTTVDTVFFVSDGTDWYTISDQTYLDINLVYTWTSVTNGDFETGDLTGFTQLSGTGSSGITSSNQINGTYSAFTSSNNNDDGIVSIKTDSLYENGMECIWRVYASVDKNDVYIGVLNGDSNGYMFRVLIRDNTVNTREISGGLLDTPSNTGTTTLDSISSSMFNVGSIYRTRIYEDGDDVIVETYDNSDTLLYDYTITNASHSGPWELHFTIDEGDMAVDDIKYRADNL